MFSNQFKAVFIILGNALLRLANLSADWKPEDEETRVFTGNATDYIADLDEPDAGTALPDATTGNAAQVFGSGADVAQVFQPAAPAPSVADTNAGSVPAAATVYTMTEAADGFTREQYHAENWTDADLIADGKMVAVAPKPTPAPAPARAPTPPAAVTPTPGATNTPAHLDSAGLPWDARIHSGGRSMTTAGAWTKKKNVQPAIVAQVEAELRQKAPAPSFTPLAASTAPAPAAPAPAAPPAAAAAPAPAPAPRPPESTGEIKTFMDLCKWNGANNIAPDQLKAACAAVGIPGLGVLAEGIENPMIPTFLSVLRQISGK